MLVVGGAPEISLLATNGVKPAEIWDPDTETWTTVASMARPRMYHSIAILLADGRVLAAGGGRINLDVPNEENGEFYSPPYLFNGPRPVVTSAPASVNYGASFTVALPNPAAAARVTFVRASSVTHGINLDQRFFELSFTAGAGTLNVTAPNDSRLAPAGDYFLYVLNANGVPSLGRVVRLGGAPSAASLVIGDVSVNEGTAAGNNAVFSVTLNGTSAQTVTVNYATSNGTALADSDYSSRSGTLSFPPGTTSRTISVPTVADAMPESNETFSVALSGAANATIGDATAVGTIVDDDAPAASALSVNSVSVPEGNSGTPVAAFTVTLSAASAQNVLVDFRTVPGTATSPADFTSTTGTLTFAGGTTVQTVQVPIVPDHARRAQRDLLAGAVRPGERRARHAGRHRDDPQRRFRPAAGDRVSDGDARGRRGTAGGHLYRRRHRSGERAADLRLVVRGRHVRRRLPSDARLPDARCLHRDVDGVGRRSQRARPRRSPSR